jgi:Protein of unknown function (DUF2721)
MTSATQITDVAHTIQLAVAPVFLFAGIGGFLNMCAGRLARIIDRARAIEPLLLKARGAEHERYVAEIRTLDKRISVVNNCTQLFGVDLGTMIALLFIASMLMIGAAFALFIQETRLGSRIVHIRNEILYHEAGD